MSVVLVVAAVWIVLALGVALLLGGAIRVADRNQLAEIVGRNFAVDGNPFAAPLPAAPLLETPGASLMRLAPRLGRAAGQD